MLVGLLWQPTSAQRGLAPQRPDDYSSAAKPREDTSPKRREGDRVEELVGMFSRAGERTVFVTADGRASFIALENLTLQRVAERIDNGDDALSWVVSGVVTEYRDHNFLLITYAATTSATPGPASRKRPFSAE